jgi:K+-sensing histidine kinase KdpD
VKKIVEEHGGLITAENVQSGGALVQIRLQLLNEDVGADDTARNTSPETPSSGNGGL